MLVVSQKALLVKVEMILDPWSNSQKYYYARVMLVLCSPRGHYGRLCSLNSRQKPFSTGHTDTLVRFFYIESTEFI